MRWWWKRKALIDALGAFSRRRASRPSAGYCGARFAFWSRGIPLRGFACSLARCPRKFVANIKPPAGSHQPAVPRRGLNSGIFCTQHAQVSDSGSKFGLTFPLHIQIMLIHALTFTWSIFPGALRVALTEAKRKKRRRFEPANAREGASLFRDQLVHWSVPRAIVEDFVQHHTLLNYRKAAVIFSQGSRSDFLAWVQSGVVETAYREVDGHRIVTRLVGPGEIFGHQSFVGPHGHLVHCFEFRARTNCQIALVSHERVVTALQTLAPTALVRLLQNITAAWAETEQYGARFLSMNYRQRLETIFVDLATRFGARGRQGTVLTLELGHYDLARMIDCSRPMLSQLIATMVRAGKILRRDKRYVVLHGKERPAVAARL